MKGFLKMCFKFCLLRLLLFLSVATCLSLSAAEIPDELAAKRNDVLRVMFNECYTPEQLLPRLSWYLALLYNHNDKTGRVIADNASHYAIALSPDGNYCAFALDKDNSVVVYDIRADKLIRSFSGQTAMIKCLAFSPDGKFLFSGSANGSVCCWNFTTGDLILKRTCPRAGVCCYKFSPDCHAILVKRGVFLRCWDFSSGNELDPEFFGNSTLISVEDFAAPGHVCSRILEGDGVYNQKLCVYDIVNKHKIFTIPFFHSEYRDEDCRDDELRGYCVGQLAYANNKLAVCYDIVAHSIHDVPPYFVDILDATTGLLLKKLLIEIAKRPIQLFFSPDGSFLAVTYELNGKNESGVAIYDVSSSKIVQELSFGFTYRPGSAAYDRNGRATAVGYGGQIATIGFDGKVRLFNSIPHNVQLALHSLSLNQLLDLMTIIEPVARGHIIHSSKALYLVRQMPSEMRAVVEPYLRPDVQ